MIHVKRGSRTIGRRKRLMTEILTIHSGSFVLESDFSLWHQYKSRPTLLLVKPYLRHLDSDWKGIYFILGPIKLNVAWKRKPGKTKIKQSHFWKF